MYSHSKNGVNVITVKLSKLFLMYMNNTTRSYVKKIVAILAEPPSGFILKDLQIKIICTEIIFVLAAENFYNILSGNTLSTKWAKAICTRYLTNACVAKYMSTCFKTAHPSPSIIVLN